eukprot:Gb_38768 [translate_table: standard]
MANINGEDGKGCVIKKDVETYGPWGGEGGRPWDDVDYVALSGEVVKGPKHGGHGKHTYKFEFNPPDIALAKVYPPWDVLAKISGWFCAGCVRELKFETTSYPPYNKGKCF